MSLELETSPMTMSLARRAMAVVDLVRPILAAVGDTAPGEL